MKLQKPRRNSEVPMASIYWKILMDAAQLADHHNNVDYLTRIYSTDLHPANTSPTHSVFYYARLSSAIGLLYILHTFKAMFNYLLIYILIYQL